MHIPYISDDSSMDCCRRYYRRAIYNTLLELKPKYSLELGTYLYQTSHVFSKYYKQYCPEGWLITADISTWNRGGTPRNVYPVMVYPHIMDIEAEHGGIDVYYRSFRNRLLKGEDTVELNCNCIQETMIKLNIWDRLDLCFVDADHTRKSFLADLAIAKICTKEDGWILIDDINDRGHEQFDVYRELQTCNHFYEYEDWEISPGLALIQNKDLVL